MLFDARQQPMLKEFKNIDNKKRVSTYYCPFTGIVQNQRPKR